MYVHVQTSNEILFTRRSASSILIIIKAQSSAIYDPMHGWYNQFMDLKGMIQWIYNVQTNNMRYDRIEWSLQTNNMGYDPQCNALQDHTT